MRSMQGCDSSSARNDFRSVTRHHPRCSLFPCTTLFRSDRDLAVRAVDQDRLRVQQLAFPGRRIAGMADGQVPRQRLEDRKSTRLNSSHGYISYAVFCLKKKNERKQTAFLAPERCRGTRV